MINKRDLEIVLGDQSQELENLARRRFCDRKEEELIDLTSPQAQVVIGVRRCGKSTLCYQALHRAGVRYGYVDFDDERLLPLETSQLNDVLEVVYKTYGDVEYLFLDEIQNVQGWHLFVNRLLRQGMHVIVTGSNAKLLSSDLATHLSGRNKEISLYPFSFGEYCVMQGVDIKRQTTRNEAARRAAFDQYMEQGGFPEMLTMSDRRFYVRNLVDNILKSDIEPRFKIHYKAVFETIAQHLLNNAPTTIVLDDLAKTFGVKSTHTIKNYVDYLKQGYLIAGLHRYSPKSKLRLTQEKVYAIDVAMMNQRDDAFAGENLGHRLETIVFLHLLRQCKFQGLDVYYMRERTWECDFVVCRGNTVLQAIQVAYDITAPKTRHREINGLLRAAEKTGCTNLLLLTDFERSTTEVDGHRVTIQPVYEWCLSMGF